MMRLLTGLTLSSEKNISGEDSAGAEDIGAVAYRCAQGVATLNRTESFKNISMRKISGATLLPEIVDKRKGVFPVTKIERTLTIALLIALPKLCPAADGQLKVKAVNKLQIARPNQTIELSAKDLAPLGNDLTKIHVKDARARKCSVRRWTQTLTRTTSRTS